MGRLIQPILRTERLRLDPLGAEHTEALVELDSDPEVLRHVFGRALTRQEAVEEWMPRRLAAARAVPGLGYWVGHRIDDGRFVGWWLLVPTDDGVAELGYRLRRDAWGCGYATEGARAVLDHGFDTVGLARVWADPSAANTGSRRVLEKLSMRTTDTATATDDHGDAIVYDLDRSTWSGGDPQRPE